MRARDEALLDGVVEEAHEAVEVAAHVEEAERLGVQAELVPRVDLEQLLERADPAGQRDEGVGELGHLRLALVHRVDHAQVGQAGMRDLAVDERLRDHAGHAAAALERGVGERAHQADLGAAVDELDPAVGQPVADVAGGGAVREVRSGARPGEDADAPHFRNFFDRQIRRRWRTRRAPAHSDLTP